MSRHLKGWCAKCKAETEWSYRPFTGHWNCAGCRERIAARARLRDAMVRHRKRAKPKKPEEAGTPW